MDQNSDGPLKIKMSDVPDGPEITLEGKEVLAKVALPTPTAADLSAQVDTIGELLRALIVTAKRLPRGKALDAHQDPVRSLALAQSHLQTGFLWLRKAIEMPKEF